MNVNDFLKVVESLGGTFFTGVPDSLLSPFIDTVVNRYGISDRHIVAANEGAAVGLAAGHYLATSKPAVVYMQNSGIGNATNPICSLLHEKVYCIPVIFVIGWRGEPGVKDEPQHLFQGEITLQLLKLLEVPYIVISKDTTDLNETVTAFKEHIENGKSVAFVIKKDALTDAVKKEYNSDAKLSREEALEIILAADVKKQEPGAVYVCTTGKLSREVYEIRERQKSGHGADFLTVGSMGHSISIALGIALRKPEKRVFCLDGDGAVLMHLGSLAVTGAFAPDNLVHIVINNGAHETVGGLPTVAGGLNLADMAKTFGYKYVMQVRTQNQLEEELVKIKNISGPVFIEVVCNLHSRSDLGRPKSTPKENKNEFMLKLINKEP